MPQIQCAVQRGLTSHGRQNGIGAFFGNDFFYRLPSNGFYVGGVCRGRIRHDGGRIAVDQHHAVTLFAQGFAGLYARIIKLTSLTNDDGASPNDKNGFEI